jgi:hypothetical protein
MFNKQSTYKSIFSRIVYKMSTPLQSVISSGCDRLTIASQIDDELQRLGVESDQLTASLNALRSECTDKKGARRRKHTKKVKKGGKKHKKTRKH